MYKESLVFPGATVGDGAASATGFQALDALYSFVAAIELTPSVAVHCQDREGRVRFWNSTCAAVFGVPTPEALGQPLDKLVEHVGNGDFDSMIEQIWRTGVAPAPRDWEVRLRDGGRRWMYSSHFPVVHDGVTQQVFCMEFDISDRHMLEDSLQHAGRVFNNAHNAMLVLDADQHVLALNRAFTELSGLQKDAVVGKPAPGLFGIIDERAETRTDAKTAAGAEAAQLRRVWHSAASQGHWEGELAVVRGDGQSSPVWLALTAIREPAGIVNSYVAVLTDISERKAVEQRARHQAEHDALTGLPNRVLFLDRLQQALAKVKRQHNRFALMFLDLDNFKGINDNHGHHAGDAVLQQVALRLTQCVRGVDTVCRLGGDEFVVLLADSGGADQAAHVATTIMGALAQPMHASGQELRLTVSIGIAICPNDGEDEDTLLRHADAAMYHAKQNGRSAFQFFSADMNAHVQARVQLENQLRAALINGEFVLEYQPEIDMASGHVVAAEALIRWRHPQRGLLLPGDFLAVAEDCGLAVPIGNWVLHEACRQAKVWRDGGLGMTVAVNLSASQFIDHLFIDTVDHALLSTGLPADALELEVTEAVIMRGDAATGATMTALTERGVHLTVDDFGTGYSSLSWLRRFPLSKLKIDRSFVDDIVSDPNEAGMIPAIIAVARSLKLKVLAEGVETDEQLRFLVEHGCDEYQGYIAAPPALVPNFTVRLR
ncbi:putative bifunctional diguanylate cyclase/phosphodiesterase [Massilia sp. S19_KUP03_FR1]|uniref:putative bifunctional diguanylate cyclase/phosphodiesterase n=1 Tax=Massilia sp. S19_KUP03_FR1 TaxID=3025503 RepID=UPI002FCDA1E8